MKDGMLYAGRLKKAYKKLLTAVSKPDIPEPEDAMYRLAVGILGTECGDATAKRAVNRTFNTLADWNEARVSSAIELNRATGNLIPQGVQRCARLRAALQSIYNRENMLSLDRLRSMGRRDARRYLEELDGVDEYTVASIILWSLGGHAIPVDDKVLKALRDNELVNPEADRAEVQAFLERNISAAQAKEFCLVIASLGSRKRAESARNKTKAKPRAKAKPKNRTAKAKQS